MKILICGAGGVGSWLVKFLCDAIRKDIIKNKIEVWVADGDTVEPKNFLYSNFDEVTDTNKNKADALSNRYHIKPIPRYITKPEEVKGYDIVVVATDDAKTKKLVYENTPFWIDLRAKGKAYAIYISGGKIQPPLDLKRPRGSCQYTERLQRKYIDYGNIISAIRGHQAILNKIRGEANITHHRGTM